MLCGFYGNQSNVPVCVYVEESNGDMYLIKWLLCWGAWPGACAQAIHFPAMRLHVRVHACHVKVEICVG